MFADLLLGHLVKGQISGIVGNEANVWKLSDLNKVKSDNRYKSRSEVTQLSAHKYIC